MLPDPTVHVTQNTHPKSRGGCSHLKPQLDHPRGHSPRAFIHSYQGLQTASQSRGQGQTPEDGLKSVLCSRLAYLSPDTWLLLLSNPVLAVPSPGRPLLLQDCPLNVSPAQKPPALGSRDQQPSPISHSLPPTSFSFFPYTLPHPRVCIFICLVYRLGPFTRMQVS